MKSFITTAASLLIISNLFAPQGHCADQPDQNSVKTLQSRCQRLEQQVQQLTERVTALEQPSKVKTIKPNNTPSRSDEWMWRWPIYKLVTFLIVSYYTNPQKISH